MSARTRRRRRVGPGGDGDGIGGYYQSVEELKRHHTRIFSPATHVAYIERPVVGRSFGLSHTTVRIRYGHPDVQGELRKGLFKIYEKYPGAEFTFNVTADVITRGPRGNSYGVFYGQDYADRNLSMYGPHEVFNVRDADTLPVDFDVGDFADVFEAAFPDSLSTVVDIIALVYIGVCVIDHLAGTHEAHLRQLYLY